MGKWIDYPKNLRMNPADRPPRYFVAEQFPAYFDTDQLYNLNKDSAESVNLANNPEYAKKLKLMKSKLRAHSENLPYSFAKFTSK